MRTCPLCERVMERDTSSGKVVFKCYCGESVEGTPADARVAGGMLHSEETEEMYRRLLRNAAHDRVNEQVEKDCPVCGLDYMTQVRVGAREAVVYVCKCGFDSSQVGAATST